MKVLKKGRAQKGWAKELNCTGSGNGGGGCGALLLVEEADLFQTSKTYMDGETDYFVTFECPSCNVLTDTEDYKGARVRSLPKTRPSQRSAD